MARWRHNEWRRGSSSNIAGDDGMHVPDRFVCRNSVVEYHSVTALAQPTTQARLWDPRKGCRRAYMQLGRTKRMGRGIWRREEVWGLNLSPGQFNSVVTSDTTSPLFYITTHFSTCLTNPATLSPFMSPESSDVQTCLVSHHTSKICEPQHMIALRMRRKKAMAVTLLGITCDLSRPPCDFIHNSCAQCQIFRQDSDTWQPGACQAVVGCKCPRYRLRYDSKGPWEMGG